MRARDTMEKSRMSAARLLDRRYAALNVSKYPRRHLPSFVCAMIIQRGCIGGVENCLV